MSWRLLLSLRPQEKRVVQPRVLQPTRQHEKMRDEPNLYAAIQVCADDLPGDFRSLRPVVEANESLKSTIA